MVWDLCFTMLCEGLRMESVVVSSITLIMAEATRSHYGRW
jgi:hypothetical protein